MNDLLSNRRDFVVILKDGEALKLRPTNISVNQDEKRVYIFDGAEIMCIVDLDEIRLLLFCDMTDDLIEHLMN